MIGSKLSREATKCSASRLAAVFLQAMNPPSWRHSNTVRSTLARGGPIFDSHATGPVLRLIIEKLCEQIEAGKSYSEIKLKTIQYQKRIRILYSLESLENLARNGRVNTHVARFAKALNIRVVGHASDEGTVELLHKCRGDNRALKAIVEEMANRGYASGKVHIDHCLNAVLAAKLKGMIEEVFPLAQVEIHPCGALCSYYADKGGLIVGYEVD